jgi:hypothetical protein
MKSTIDGKRYDTGTATIVAEWNNGRPASDSRWCSERLYRKERSGKFFLHGEGGALSRYSRRHAGDSVGYEAIFPCSRSEAEWWCEKTEQQEALSVDRHDPQAFPPLEHLPGPEQ